MTHFLLTINLSNLYTAQTHDKVALTLRKLTFSWEEHVPITWQPAFLASWTWWEYICKLKYTVWQKKKMCEKHYYHFHINMTYIYGFNWCQKAAVTNSSFFYNTSIQKDETDTVYGSHVLQQSTGPSVIFPQQHR